MWGGGERERWGHTGQLPLSQKDVECNDLCVQLGGWVVVETIMGTASLIPWCLK